MPTDKLNSQNSVEDASNGGSAGNNYIGGHSNLLNKLGAQNMNKNKKTENQVYKEYFHATNIGKQKYGSGTSSKGGAVPL